MSKQLFVVLMVTWVCLLLMISVTSYSSIRIASLEKLSAKNKLDISDLKTQIAAKVQPKIKFYTIPGYDCDTSEIEGHCTKWNISQAEYDKKNSHLFKVTQ